MKKLIITCLFGLMFALISVRADEPKKDDTKKADAPAVKEVAVIKTTAGEMVIELWPDVAPKTVENFKKLANDKFYDGTAFHRIIKHFMIQGGDNLTKDPAAADRYGSGGPGYTNPDEFSNKHHDRGVISMANTGAPHSSGSQFFICLDPSRYLDGHYTIFGKLIKGDDVLTKLGDAECGGPQGSTPKERQGVISVKIVPADSIK